VSSVVTREAQAFSTATPTCSPPPDAAIAERFDVPA
jgi:hypothetical protein